MQTLINIRGCQLDIFQHVNNARYLEFLEEARWIWLEEKGSFRWMSERGLAAAGGQYQLSPPGDHGRRAAY